MCGQRTRVLGLLTILVLILVACSREKDIQEYLQDGRNYLESGDFSKAMSALEEVLKRDPELAEAHRLMGEALGSSGRWIDAVDQFKAYQALAKDDVDAYFWLGRAYVQVGDLKQAAATFAEGAQLDPSFLASRGEEIAEAADVFLDAGQEALKEGDLGTATDLLTMVAPLVPGQGEVYVLLGQAHLQANDVARALAAYADAVNLSPDLANEYADEIRELGEQGLMIGQTAWDARDLTRAGQVMEHVAVLLPNQPEAHFLLGNIYNEANQFAQAIEQYQTVLSLDPGSSSAHTNMGVVYYKIGDLETAIKEYNAALELEPDDAETHYLLGAAYVQREQLEEGKAEFETALALDDQLAPPYIGLGNIYLLQGDPESAVEALKKAQSLSPNSPEAFFALGQAFIQLGDVVEARAAFEQVLSLNPAPQWRQQVEAILESLDSE